MENQTEPTVQSGVTYASFGKRYAAHMIDYVILTFFCAPLYNQIIRDVGRMRKYLPKIRGKHYRRMFGEEGGGDYQSMMFGMDTTTMFFTNVIFIVTVGLVTWC